MTTYKSKDHRSEGGVCTAFSWRGIRQYWFGSTGSILQSTGCVISRCIDRKLSFFKTIFVLVPATCILTPSLQVPFLPGPRCTASMNVNSASQAGTQALLRRRNQTNNDKQPRYSSLTDQKIPATAPAPKVGDPSSQDTRN